MAAPNKGDTTRLETIIAEQNKTIQLYSDNINRHQTSLNELLVSLECPVCLETCQPPIFTCLNSHIVCSQCRLTLDKCPICLIDGRFIVNRFAEEFTRKYGGPCEYAYRGCKAFVLNDTALAHVNVCRYRFSCYYCNFHYDISGLKEHLTKCHKDRYVVGEKWEGDVPYSKEEDTRDYVIYISSMKGVFAICFSSQSSAMYINVDVLGTVELAAKCKVWFKFIAEDLTYRASYLIQCKSDRKQVRGWGTMTKISNEALYMLNVKRGNEVFCKIKISP